MNDTKWRELCSAFQNSGLRYKVKDLTALSAADWDGEWYYHPLPYFRIEWLEIDAKTFWQGHSQVTGDRTGEIIATLVRHNIPFSREGDNIRVWGYLRPGPKPEIVK
jgi:hypothetical protein